MQHNYVHRIKITILIEDSCGINEVVDTSLVSGMRYQDGLR